jgi:NDP-sugar pyrophosphorylase family protein
LLAAGRGRRLRPHTDHTPKPLLPVHGRPTLDYVLTAAANAGMETACVVTHHLGEQIEAFVGDGAAWGLTAVTCRQPHLDGAASALRTAVSAYPQLFAEERPFLLTATDYALPPFFLRALVQAHRDNDAEITISLKRLPPSEISSSSSVAFRPDGRIERIIEKPAPGAAVSAVAASLIFVLPGGARDYLQDLTRSPRGEFEIQDVINRMLQGEYTARGLVQEAPPEPSGTA